MIAHPEWLLKLMSEREHRISNAKDAKVVNYDEDYPERQNRLPSGQCHIVSSEGRFTVDAKRRMIIA